MMRRSESGNLPCQRKNNLKYRIILFGDSLIMATITMLWDQPRVGYGSIRMR